MESEYPRTIENGAGERLTFLGVRTGDEGREYLDIESRVAPGAGPALHVHLLQEEGMTVRAGRVGYQVAGGPQRFAGPGETVLFRPGEMHRYWNAGDDELHLTGWVSPPHNLEYFLTELFASMRRSGGGRPNPLDAAYLLARFRTEFGIGEIPAPVQRFVFPVMRTAGRVVGRHRRYAAAPPSVEH